MTKDRLFKYIQPLMLFCLLAMMNVRIAQAFELSNGYFYLSGNQGLVTTFRLDATGKGNYGSNTIAATGHLGFVVGGTLMSSASAVATVNGQQLTVTGLPQSAALQIVLNGKTMMARLAFPGTYTVRHEWDLVYLDGGFYQRSTGQNYDPDQSVDMPFESFYDAANGIFRPVEHFKKSSGQTSDLNWPKTYCRGRLSNDVVFSCSHASMDFVTGDEKLTLAHEASATTSVTASFEVRAKSYGASLDGDKPLPEFYVLPEKEITAFSDASVKHTASQLLTELFHHSVFWYGFGGGLWGDWSMRAGSFMDTPYRDGMLSSISNWIIGLDGYGHYGLAYAWGDSPNWPFPGGGKDTRHFNTNSIFITQVWRYIMWSGDKDFLNSGAADLRIKITYSSGSSAFNFASSTYPPFKPTAAGTLGQTFKAGAAFTAVAAQNATWGASGCGHTLTLYSSPGGSKIASKTFTDCTDGALDTLTFSAQPAGTYYLEMSAPVGAISWWGRYADAYSAGQAYRDGHPIQSIMDRCRTLMQYQEQTLLGGTENLLVLGTNIGSADHGARHATDVGSNYYDILPFGYKDAFSNITYYTSVRGMADLEEFMGNADKAQQYRAKLPLVRNQFNETFWRTDLDRTKASRYIGCVDVNGADHDYGFTFINTQAIEAGLTQDDAGRVENIFDWLDHGECFHSDEKRSNAVWLEFSDGETDLSPNPNKGDAVANLLQSGSSFSQTFFAPKPFTAVGSNNPTWSTKNSGFTLSLYRLKPYTLIASKAFTNVIDNSINTIELSEQDAGYYVLKMSNPVGSIGWWSSPWESDIYRRWVFAPRASTKKNTDWWAWPQGTGSGTTYDPANVNWMWRWDMQLQNGGADLYEMGFDIVARAKYYDPDNAWDRMYTLLRRYTDPDRLCSKTTGFYGESIQGDGNAGSVGWLRSEFPETAALGSAFFLGFFGIEPAVDGLRISPKIPTQHGITAIGSRNIEYQGARFSFEATTKSVTVRCTYNPENKTFYMTGGMKGTGVFSKAVPLNNGTMVLSLTQQGTGGNRCKSVCQLYE